MSTTPALAQPQSEEKLKDYLQRDDVKKRLAAALGKKIDVEEFVSNILMDIAKSDKLQQCSQTSVLQAAIDAANFGLVPNKTLGHAYLVPYNNRFKDKDGKWKNRQEAQLIIGYKGYVKKMAEHGANVEVELVTVEEVNMGMFKEVRGTESKIVHYPIRKGLRTQENIECGYAIIRQEGRRDINIAMSLEEIMEVAKSQVWEEDETGNKVKRFGLKGVWKESVRDTDFGEMCKKTLIRRAGKLSEIDIVNRMSAYEGEFEERALKNVTPADTMPSLVTGFQSNIRGIEENKAAPMEPVESFPMEAEKMPAKPAAKPQAAVKPATPPAQPEATQKPKTYSVSDSSGAPYISGVTIEQAAEELTAQLEGMKPSKGRDDYIAANRPIIDEMIGSGSLFAKKLSTLI